jgi:hypothetical protein
MHQYVGKKKSISLTRAIIKQTNKPNKQASKQTNKQAKSHPSHHTRLLVVEVPRLLLRGRRHDEFSGLRVLLVQSAETALGPRGQDGGVLLVRHALSGEKGRNETK